jgi:hypothetical protein
MELATDIFEINRTAADRRATVPLSLLLLPFALLL